MDLMVMRQREEQQLADLNTLVYGVQQRIALLDEQIALVRAEVARQQEAARWQAEVEEAERLATLEAEEAAREAALEAEHQQTVAAILRSEEAARNAALDAERQEAVAKVVRLAALDEARQEAEAEEAAQVEEAARKRPPHFDPDA